MPHHGFYLIWTFEPDGKDDERGFHFSHLNVVLACVPPLQLHLCRAGHIPPSPLIKSYDDCISKKRERGSRSHLGFFFAFTAHFSLSADKRIFTIFPPCGAVGLLLLHVVLVYSA